ncbi:MAG TPA: WcaI family glycosyltransferase [Chitinophagaceae bacterium]|nr:WcaI family glycosyltransferase [Chitinophagaceae bacterium]
MKQKRILLIGGNFYPEPTGIGKYNGEMADFLANTGYQCTVITSYPYYPFWKTQEPYSGKAYWYKKETRAIAGTAITIYRCPQYVPQNPTGKKRMLLDLSFFLSSFFKIFHLLFKKKYDYVITVAPCFQIGLLGLFYKKIKGAKLIYHMQDLQIDAARDLKILRSKLFITFLLRIERFILKHADVVSTISAGMIKKIEAKYKRTVTYFPNWVDTKVLYPLQEKQKLKEDFGFRATDIIALYSGAIGEKQGLEDIIHAAKFLSKIPDLKFVICGSGPYKEKLKALKEELGTDNVHFLSLQPIEKLNGFLNMADIHLVLQKANAGDLVMPSKLTGILSVGGVAVITTSKNTSLYEMISVNNIGIVAEPESRKELTAAIEKLIYSDKELISKNAANYAREFFSIEKVFYHFSTCLQ